MGPKGKLAALILWAPIVVCAGQASPNPPYQGEITGERVYVRAGDGINYTVLAVAERGDRVSVVRRRFSWLGIAVPKTCTVWVHKALLAPDPDGKRATVAKDRVNIRARADRRADILGQLPAGARVELVDADGDWAGIAPPTQATAWVHSKFLRKTARAATRPKPGTRTPTTATMDAAGGLALLRQARQAYTAQLDRPPKQRSFDQVLKTYQKVAAECQDQAVARRAEQARQRLLKIVDLHHTLRALREPLEQFRHKYDALEREYQRRANPPGDKKDE